MNEGFIFSGRTSPTPPKEGLTDIKGCTPTSIEKIGKTCEVLPKPGYVTVEPSLYAFLREIQIALKENSTLAEEILWDLLRNKKTGHKIRRQHILGPFIPDFVCLSKKVIIEVDGMIHLSQKPRDEDRTRILEDLGYDVIRFTNEDVFANPALVVKNIKNYLDNK